MDKNNLNLNLSNKFGKCCNCPAIGNGQYLFTNNVSSRIYNDQMGKILKVGDSHAYRTVLQNNAKKFMNNEILKFELTRCKDSKDYKFYIDSSNYNPSKKLTDEYKGQKMINDGNYNIKFSNIK